MDAETYRVDIAFEVLAEPDPDRIAKVAYELGRLLPAGSQTLLLSSTAASPDGLARVAATVHAAGPAMALHHVAQALELMAAEVGRLEDVGPMRRAVVEYLGG
jgi:hypothetical protein